VEISNAKLSLKIKVNASVILQTFIPLKILSGDDFDLTVRDFKGRWGSTKGSAVISITVSLFGKTYSKVGDLSWESPHGPTGCVGKGCEGDRDYNGSYDDYWNEK